MTDTAAVTGEVFLRDGVPDEDGEHVRTWLTDLGLNAHVRRLPPRRDAGLLAWAVLVALPLHGLLEAVGAKVGEDAWAGVKRLTGSLGRRKAVEPAPNRPIVLQDSATGLQIVLEADLPDEAFTQLTALDLSAFRHGPLHYDRTAKRWRSLLDEAAG